MLCPDTDEDIDIYSEYYPHIIGAASAGYIAGVFAGHYLVKPHLKWVKERTKNGHDLHEDL